MLITLALVGAVFVVIADLMSQAARVLTQQNTRTVSEQAAQIAMQRLTCEAREAIFGGVTFPSTTSVQIQKVDPTATRFTGSSAAPFPNTPLMTVLYQLNPDQTLTRAVTASNGNGSQVVAHGLTGFTATTDATTGNVVFVISIQEDTLVRTIRSEVWLPTTP